MEYKVEIINFGKIKHATLQFNHLTVFVGTNNTGKSYVSRILYSIFSVLTDNPEQYYQQDLLTRFFDELSHANTLFRRSVGTDDKRNLDIQADISAALKSPMDAMENQRSRSIHDSNLAFAIGDRYNDESQALLGEVEILLSTLKTIAQDVAADNSIAEESLNSYYDALDKGLANLQNELDKGPEHIIIKGYANEFKKSLLHNFQAEELKDLLGNDKRQGASINIKSTDGDDIRLTISKAGIITDVYVDLAEPDIYSNVVYLESPTYWKLKDKLSSHSLLDRTIERGRQLDGVPKHFQDLIEKMRVRQITNDKDIAIKENLADKIKDLIGGQITEDKNSGELLFVERTAGSQQNHKGISLHLTATGVSQLGMLAYLIDKKVIRKGTILFVDEPEAHLHTEWQEKITETLYDFTQHGIQVIMATHSPIIIQQLEVFMKHAKPPQKISLNFFDKSGKFDTTKQTSEEINDAVAKSLEEPAFNIYLKSF